ncbi:hypothetical protein DMUE_2402 [Dictyocoela muelleri]|nr:hypothetical protein DMUE_2402 [Dictyocoela muelleri]
MMTQEIQEVRQTLGKKRNVINDSMFEQIKQMISINKSIADIKQICNISRASAYRAISKIDGSNRDISFSEAFKAPGRHKADKGVVLSEITNIFASDNSLTQVGLGDKLRERGIGISKSQIGRLVKNCSLSRKKTQK